MKYLLLKSVVLYFFICVQLEAREIINSLLDNQKIAEASTPVLTRSVALYTKALYENAKDKKLDLFLDSEERLFAHVALQQKIEEEPRLPKFVVDKDADGCSGDISKIWARDVVVLLPKLEEIFGDRFPFEACCDIHDLRYYYANADVSEHLVAKEAVVKTEMNIMPAKKSFWHRKITDLKFYQCIKDYDLAEYKKKFKKAYPAKDLTDFLDINFVAKTMYFGTRLGGDPCTKKDYRWGYGYANCAAE